MKIEIAPNKIIGKGNPCFFIAEAGINHCGSLELAKELIDIAVTAGADCVKFQKRCISRILTKEGLDMEYKTHNSYGETYGKHKEALEFTYSEFRELQQYAHTRDILFTASGWDEDSVDFLDSINVPFFKMASADLTNLPLLEHTAKKGRPIIISTGMADMKMVEMAYNVIKKYNNDIIILQCTSSYPCPDTEINLEVIKLYENAFEDAVIGYSGHEKGIAISLAAVAMGAKVIERHFTKDRTFKGSDHAASLELPGLKKLIRDIRIIENAKGQPIKVIEYSETECIKKLRKSIVSACVIKKDQIITKDMLTTKGPGTGISPMYIESIIGKRCMVDIECDKIITHGMFNS